MPQMQGSEKAILKHVTTLPNGKYSESSLAYWRESGQNGEMLSARGEACKPQVPNVPVCVLPGVRLTGTTTDCAKNGDQISH